jgi:hypothetical protein
MQVWYKYMHDMQVYKVITPGIFKCIKSLNTDFS